MTRLNLLAHPLRARVVMDIAPDYSRRVYVSKFAITAPQDVQRLVEAIMMGAIEIARSHGIVVTGFSVTPPAAPEKPNA